MILTLRINDFDVRRIVVDLGISIDLLQMSAYKQMGFPSFDPENPEQILSGFNEASTTSLGDVVLPVKAEPII